jgi:hypothetical protein
MRSMKMSDKGWWKELRWELDIWFQPLIWFVEENKREFISLKCCVEF